MLNRPFTGVIAAPFLPMHDDGEMDWATLERYIDWIAGQKPAAIAMNMDASEVIGLTKAEQDEVVHVCRRPSRARPFVSGIVAGSTRAAAAKAERFARAGVDGLCVFPPLPTFSGSPVPGEMITVSTRPSPTRKAADHLLSVPERLGARLHA